MKIRLNKILNIRSILILIALFALTVNIAFSQELFMPVSDVKPGMRGIGKTVFHGTEIKNFGVEIIDVISGENNISEFILARLNGERLEENGGISGGMSGSPVYVNDKLIGAISYGWELSEHDLCLITPIEEMLKLFSLPYGYKLTKSKIYKVNNSIDFNGKKIGKIIVKNRGNTKDCNVTNLANKGEIIFYPVVSPLTVTGLTGRSFNKLSEKIGNYNLRVVQGFNHLNKSKFQEIGESSLNKIEGGSAIGIQLTRGDVNICSIGTVTYREGNKILALGHPFLKKGETSYLLSSIYIYHSLPNMIMPFKIGSPLNLIGKVIQDREAGIAAMLNSYPRVIPLKIKVENINSEENYQMGVQIVDDYQLLETFVSNIALQAIDNALDRIGAGSAQIEIKIRGMEDGQEFFRKNMYCSLEDIAVQTISEIPEIINLIIHNYFKKVNLTEININIRIDNKIKWGKIEEVKIEETDLKPGDLLKAEVKIRAFRGDLIKKLISIKIPSDIQGGEATLIVKGGKSEYISEEEEYFDSEKDNYKSLEEAFKDISDRTRNNQLVGEIITYCNEIPKEKKIDGD
ncbi:MAG: SpoIVB peptidase S55 domain-containing protein, partial [Candidatus Caldatribacteriota bacterium]|nr:SpoIVB peptidase S55 domain-containing protein [Candidatus Caldatribacteriota bacterium]